MQHNGLGLKFGGDCRRSYRSSVTKFKDTFFVKLQTYAPLDLNPCYRLAIFLCCLNSHNL